MHARGLIMIVFGDQLSHINIGNILSETDILKQGIKGLLDYRVGLLHRLMHNINSFGEDRIDCVKSCIQCPIRIQREATARWMFFR